MECPRETFFFLSSKFIVSREVRSCLFFVSHDLTGIAKGHSLFLIWFLYSLWSPLSEWKTTVQMCWPLSQLHDSLWNWRIIFKFLIFILNIVDIFSSGYNVRLISVRHRDDRNLALCSRNWPYFKIIFVNYLLVTCNYNTRYANYCAKW